MRPSVRPELAGLEPYAAPQVDAAVRLNTNECPYPLPEGFARDLAEAVARIRMNRYPDREATALRKGLAEHTGHPAEGVWAANGSNEVIQHICLAYGGPGRRALVFEPTYSLHSLIPRIAGMDLARERLGDAFALPPEAADLCRRHGATMVFVCSPNNPTGNAQPVEAVAALCEAAEGLVVVDEAYGEFGGRSTASLLPDHPNLVVVRTFSKAFALAGARVGYCLAQPDLVQELKRVRLPYHLSALAQAAGEAALNHADEALAILDRVRDERDRLLSGLGSLDGVEPFPSEANFVLFRTPLEAPRLWRALLDREVLVRDVSSAAGLECCLRVTAGTPEETDAFLAALRDALEEAR
jgi:histidinol-phosphate aminotransferase